MPPAARPISCRAPSSSSRQQSGQSFVIENRALRRPRRRLRAGQAIRSGWLHHPGSFQRHRHRAGDPVERALRSGEGFFRLTPLGNVPLVLVVAPSKGMKTLKSWSTRRRPAWRDHYGAAGSHAAASGDGALPACGGLRGPSHPFQGRAGGADRGETGRVDMYFCPITPALPQIRDGKVLALAVSSSRRASALPDVPTTIEAGVPRVRSRSTFGSARSCRRKRRAIIVAKMQSEIVKAIRNPATQGKLKTLGVEEEMIMARTLSTHASPRKSTSPEACQGRQDRDAVRFHQPACACRVGP